MNPSLEKDNDRKNWRKICFLDTYQGLISKQVWVCEGYDAGDPNFYIHRDIIIPAFPLCTAWLDCPLKGGERGIVF